MALDDQRRKLERLDATFCASADFLRQLLKARQSVRTHWDQALGRPTGVGRAPAASRRVEPPAHLCCELRHIDTAAFWLNTAAPGRPYISAEPGTSDLSTLHERLPRQHRRRSISIVVGRTDFVKPRCVGPGMESTRATLGAVARGARAEERWH